MKDKRAMRKTYMVLALILIVGIFLRFYLIDKNSFWVDETATAMAIENRNISEIFRNAVLLGNVQPGYWEGVKVDLPVYYTALSLWIKPFGFSEASLRSFSALFGVLSILMIFLVARELTNRNVALLSSLLLSFNMANIELSQEARLYMLLAFIGLAAIYFFIKSIRTGKIMHLSMFVIMNVAGMNTHFLYSFFVFFQGVYWLLLFKIDPKNVKRILIALLVIGVAYLPWLPRIFYQNSLGVGVFLSHPTLGSAAKAWFMISTWIYPSVGLREDIYSQNISQFAILDWLLIISAFLLVIFMTFFFLSAILRPIPGINKHLMSYKFIRGVFKTQDFRYDNPILFLSLWFFIPLVSTFFISLMHPTVNIFGPVRYLILIFPAFIILVSISILNLKWKYARIAIVLFIVFSLLPILSYYSNINKQQFRETAIFMKAKVQPGDVVFINKPTMKIAIDYYFGKSGNVYGVENAMHALELSQNKDSVWLILSFDKYSDPKGTIKAFLEQKYTLIEEKEFFDIRIFHYVRNN